MPRVPLISAQSQDESIASVFGRFTEEGRDVIALYRALGNAPHLLPAYAMLARALRHNGTTPRALRELVILRTAQLTESDYEWAHHRPMAAMAGVRTQQLETLADWSASGEFDERERAALRCADEVHTIGLSDECFTGLVVAFDTAGAVEIVLVVAFYEAVARLVQGLDVNIEAEYHRYLDAPPGPASESKGD